MFYILVSSCLLGENVRYDAQVKSAVPALKKLEEQGRVISVCPEVAGGLPTPRLPAEIQCGDGYDVLNGDCDLKRVDGVSVKSAFIAGAEYALALAKLYDIKVAILKSKSPSCSNNYIYDGTFSGKLKEGVGVTTALLKAEGISVYNEDEIEAAIAHFETL